MGDIWELWGLGVCCWFASLGDSFARLSITRSEAAYEDGGACEVCGIAMNGCRSLQVIRRYEEYMPSVWLS